MILRFCAVVLYVASAPAVAVAQAIAAPVARVEVQASATPSALADKGAKVGATSSATSAAVKLLAEFETQFNLDFQKTKIGGLSGLHCESEKLWAVSDDRGKFGAPRFYEIQLNYENSKLSLVPKAVHEIKGKNLPKVLDLEAISRTPSGDFILSSEGDLNKVPRVPPSFIRVSEQGDLKQIYPLPSVFLPELTGKQKQGVQNNQAFEGMRWSDTDKSFWAVNEAALFQDYDEVKTIKGDELHFVKVSSESKLVEDHKYQLDAWSDSEDGKEIIRGVSEILDDGPNQWWVLERGVRISILGMKYSAALYHLDKEFKKTKMFEFKNAENYEGLCYGPKVEGARTILVVSDNNFSKREKTKWVLLKIP